jgi:L-ribulose-5-phosphate 4-epimerase
MIEALREQVCKANRDLERHGLLKMTWGNVSGIDRKHGLVVIKPSGVAYAGLTPADMVVLDMTGKVVEGRLRPSSDAPSHLVLYEAFGSIGGITHTHSTYATMFAQASRSIPCLGTTHADVFHGEIPLTRPMSATEVRDAYEANTGKVIVERFQDLDPVAMPGVLVLNHGPFAWGDTPAASVDHAVVLEHVARMAWGTLLLNPDARPAPGYLADKHYQRKHGPSAYYGQRSTAQHETDAQRPAV